jgi:hypothetical protein
VSPLIEITAVGALITPEGSDRPRNRSRGDQVAVSEKDAARLVGRGTAIIVDAPARAPGEFDPEAPLPDLRKFAADHDPPIELRDARSKAMVIEDIEAALTDPESEAPDG